MVDSFIRFLLDTAFLWAPVMLAIIFWKVWLSYVRADFIAKMRANWQLMQIKLPREVAKSPAAMEVVLQAFHQHSMGHWVDRWWNGRQTHWFSLEIVSIEGNIYFFIWTQKNYRPIIEAQIYSQYPQAEVQIVEDYTKYMERYAATNEWGMYSAEFELTKDDAFPIKTYIDYGIDTKAIATLDEEQRVDPITVVLEQMGSLRPGEQFWIQILIRKHESKEFRAGKPLDAGKYSKSIEQAIKDFTTEKDKEGKEQKKQLTKGQQLVLEAMERNAGKLSFDSGIRAVYLAQKDAFNASRIPMLLGILRQFGSNDLNGFKPARMTGKDMPWDDPFQIKFEKMKEDRFKAYVERGYFYDPYKEDRKPFVLTTEELATMFHFPGKVSETPSFARIEAKKAEPPPNLPI